MRMLHLGTHAVHDFHKQLCEAYVSTMDPQQYNVIKIDTFAMVVKEASSQVHGSRST
jgi:hypothetical protein